MSKAASGWFLSLIHIYKFALRIYAGIAAGIGAIGLLVLGILASVCPAILYDPPQGEVRTIMETGFWAFLKVVSVEKETISFRLQRSKRISSRRSCSSGRFLPV